MTHQADLTRRALLLSGAAGLALTACSAPRASGPGGPRAQPSSAAPSPALPAVDPYTVLAEEVDPAAKEAAARFLEAALTRSAEGPVPAGRAQPSSEGAPDPGVAGPLLGLLPAQGPSAVRIVYPQYGGLTPARDLASVMIIAEHLLLGGRGSDRAGGVLTRALSVDVRLSATAGAWRVTQVLPAQPTAAAPSVSAAAQAVLDDERIHLPGQARSDVFSARVDDRVLQCLSRLAESWSLDVSVFFSAHPTNVFATDRVSNHTRGLAVDLWALDGIPVIDHARSPWREAMLAAAEAGATEVGGPQDLGNRPFFSDQVHQDHVHIGFGAA